MGPDSHVVNFPRPELLNSLRTFKPVIKYNHDTCHVYSGDHRADTRDSRVQWPGQARDIGHWEWVSNNKSSLASSECCYNYHVCLCLISGDTPDSGHQTPDSVSSPYPLLHSKGSLSTAGCVYSVKRSVISIQHNSLTISTHYIFPLTWANSRNKHKASDLLSQKSLSRL